MELFEKIRGPKSKYDKSLPYTYEARMRILEGSDEYNSYFSDTICGLVEYLHRNQVHPGEVEIFEVYREQEFPVEAKRFTTPDHQWLLKPDICRAFENLYPGHIHDDTCSFNDRDCKGSGP